MFNRKLWYFAYTRLYYTWEGQEGGKVMSC
jgi:hypothetical protein